ncbi:MAG: hypothetical protein AAB592_02520 [Patescibacteria group bacterium]
MLRDAQTEVRSTQSLKLEQRQALLANLQEGFENEKQKREGTDRLRRENAVAVESWVAAAEAQARSSTDWRATREVLKNAQQQVRGSDLRREDREGFLNRMRVAFELVNSRQDTARHEYERECAVNAGALRAEISNVVYEAGTSSNFSWTFSHLRTVQQRLKDTGSLTRQDRDALFDALNKGFEILADRRRDYHEGQRRLRVAQERERRRSEWEIRKRERVRGLEGAIYRLQESIRRDLDHKEDLYRQKDRIRPGRRSAEIHAQLNRKAEDVGNRIWSKQEKLGDMEKSLRDLTAEQFR